MKRLLADEKRNTVLALAAVLFGAILFYVLLREFTSVRAAIRLAFGAAAPVLMGFALAYVLNIPLSFLEGRVFSRLFPERPRLSRTLALIVTLLIVPGLAALVIALILPRLIDSVTALIRDSDAYIEAAKGFFARAAGTFASPEAGAAEAAALFEQARAAIMGFLDGLASDMLPRLPRLGMRVINTVYRMVVTLVICIHSLVYRDGLLRFVRNFCTAILPKKRIEGFFSGCAMANTTFRRYVSAQALSAGVVCVLCYIGCRVLSQPYAELISVFIFIGALVPVVGPWVSIAVSAFLILMTGQGSAVGFIIMILAIQLVEDNLVYPKLIGDAIGMKGLEVLGAVIIGGGLFGFMGLLAAVPTAAVLRRLVRGAVTRRNLARAEAGETA